MAGDWVTITFTLEANAVPEVVSLALVNDTGASGTDKVTSDPSIVGQLVDDDSVAYVSVEIDQNGDGTAYGFALPVQIRCLRTIRRCSTTIPLQYIESGGARASRLVRVEVSEV